MDATVIVTALLGLVFLKFAYEGLVLGRIQVSRRKVQEDREVAAARNASGLVARFLGIGCLLLGVVSIGYAYRVWRENEKLQSVVDEVSQKLIDGK